MDNNLLSDAKRNGLNSVMLDKVSKLENFQRTHSALIHPIGDVRNILINGGFDFAERLSVPGTLTTISRQDFGPDRWWSDRVFADVQYQRLDARSEVGLCSQWYGKYKKITNDGKVFITQVVEGVNSVPLRNRSVSFSIWMKSNAAMTVRMAVLELQSTGTIDAPPPVLVTSFGAASVDPTFGADVAALNTESKSVTTAWQQFKVNAQIGATTNNVFVAIWSDSSMTTNATLSLAQAGLYAIASAPAWVPEPTSLELAKCQRYGLRLDVSRNIVAIRFSTKYINAFISFTTQMRTAPAMTHNLSAWTAGSPGTTTAAMYNYVTSAWTTITGALSMISTTSTQDATMTATAGTSFNGTAGDGGAFLTGPDVVIFFDAEIL